MNDNSISYGQLEVLWLEEALLLDACVALQRLEVVDLVGGVLVDNEQVVVELSEYEALVELAAHAHPQKVLLGDAAIELALGLLALDVLGLEAQLGDELALVGRLGRTPRVVRDQLVVLALQGRHVHAQRLHRPSTHDLVQVDRHLSRL